MRLLTQNFLACLKCESFPLEVSATDIDVIPVEFDAEFTRRMLARVDYGYLLAAYRSLAEKHAGLDKQLPDTLEGADLSDESQVLQSVHFAMNQIAIKNGELKCDGCGATYAVNEFIPNFVLENK